MLAGVIRVWTAIRCRQQSARGSASLGLCYRQARYLGGSHDVGQARGVGSLGQTGRIGGSFGRFAGGQRASRMGRRRRGRQA
ncbi:MAG TPA: hypothetical protein VKU60_12035 [Chloroflexota bacterium]|nr:hypothetical protein [Chloroflexota bacterium]